MYGSKHTYLKCRKCKFSLRSYWQCDEHDNGILQTPRLLFKCGYPAQNLVNMERLLTKNMQLQDFKQMYLKRPCRHVLCMGQLSLCCDTLVAMLQTSELHSDE